MTMSKRRWITFFILFFIELLLVVTGRGIIKYGTISITVLQVPVILAAVCLGLKQGLAVSAVFGIGSMCLAAGYAAGSRGNLFANPLISVMPRLLIPIAAYGVYRMLKKIMDDHTLSSDMISGGIAAAVGVVTNTFFTTVMMYVLYHDQLGMDKDTAIYKSIFYGLIRNNNLIEIFVGVFLCVIIIPLLLKNGEIYKDKLTRPLLNTFQKWLLLCLSLAFMTIILMSYGMMTVQAWREAESQMDIEMQDASNDLGVGVVNEAAAPYRIGVNGMLVIAKNDCIINAKEREMQGKDLEAAGLANIEPTDDFETVDIRGYTWYYISEIRGEYQIIGMIPDMQIYENRNTVMVFLILANIVIFILVYMTISHLLKNNVVKQIYDVNGVLSHIRKGELDRSVDVHSSEEFSFLSDGINATVTALKESTRQIEQKIHEELELARTIQMSVLPVQEHIVNKWHEFEVYGTMRAAKEVGGDFFDYFTVGQDRLAIVIADVSGKGIPAALFMMTAKTLIKNYTLTGHSPAEVLSYANEQFCDNNEAGMFVTVWLGILDYEKCELTFANAGHNPPVISRKNGVWDYMDHKKYKRSIMLGIRENIKYHDNKIVFEKGDRLFLYTDGVTEANNMKGDLYGEDRLNNCLNGISTLVPGELLESVRADVDAFAGDKEQFDDITMLALTMKVVREKRSFIPTYENTESVSGFVKEMLEREQCAAKVIHQMLIVVDEIYSNTVKYSDAGELWITCAVTDDYVYLVFEDDGSPYNPLEEKEPDINASKEERPIGGLGLLMVKRIMDDTEYYYQNNKNIFAVGKKL